MDPKSTAIKNAMAKRRYNTVQMKDVLASIVLGCCVFAGRFLSVTCRRSPVHRRRRVGDPCASSDDTTTNARSQTFSLKKSMVSLSSGKIQCS